ncbi:hypothetical protein ONZ45_g1324 [Pleurotus djamor]|nr:hypothetical protein ONZ45_g1324 [Pleurotus djamor]
MYSPRSDSPNAGYTTHSQPFYKRREDSPTSVSDVRSTLAVHYSEFSVYLASYLTRVAPGSRASIRAGLEKLTLQQLADLSTDVYDEIIRRKENRVPVLPEQTELHPRRNQTRQKLAVMSTQRFEDLAGDVHHELERRYPELRRRPSASPDPILDPSYQRLEEGNDAGGYLPMADASRSSRYTRPRGARSASASNPTGGYSGTSPPRALPSVQGSTHGRSVSESFWPNRTAGDSWTEDPYNEPVVVKAVEHERRMSQITSRPLPPITPAKAQVHRSAEDQTAATLRDHEERIRMLEMQLQNANTVSPQLSPSNDTAMKSLRAELVERFEMEPTRWDSHTQNDETNSDMVGQLCATVEEFVGDLYNLMHPADKSSAPRLTTRDVDGLMKDFKRKYDAAKAQIRYSQETLFKEAKLRRLSQVQESPDGGLLRVHMAAFRLAVGSLLGRGGKPRISVALDAVLQSGFAIIMDVVAFEEQMARVGGIDLNSLAESRERARVILSYLQAISRTSSSPSPVCIPFGTIDTTVIQLCDAIIEIGDLIHVRPN